MENLNTNVGKNLPSFSSDIPNKQNPPPLSRNSLLELINPRTEKKRDPPMKGQISTKKQNKLAVSPNPEKDESCKKMKKVGDKNSDGYINWSPQAWVIAKEWLWEFPFFGSGKMRGVADKCSKAIVRAKEIQSNLSPGHPSFIKAMLKSHVSKPFYTSTPVEFCKKHLPFSDEIVVFEVESGQSYNVKLLGSKFAFSGGWKGFAEAEKLLENDVLVFHLIGPCKFKVYIVRASELVPVDKAPKINKKDDLATEKEVGKKGKSERNKKRPKLVSQEFLRDLVEVNVSKKNYIRPINSNSSKEGFQSSEFASDFKIFKIEVDGTTIELPKQVREDYFKLCCNQKTYLHRHLIKGIDSGLAASVISGTVTISNAIRESKISTPQDMIAYWNKALDGFEVFGMNIGFIRARLIRLSGLTLELKRYKEAKSERKSVEEKIIELKKEKRRLDEEIEGMGKTKAMYEEEASFPW